MQKNNLGNIFITGLVALNLILWFAFPPQNSLETPYGLQFAGEVIASSLMILIAMTLVLSARPRVLEPFFGGLDKMWKTHRAISIIAFLMIILHFFTIPKTENLLNGKPIGMLAFLGFVILVLITLAPRAPFLSRFLRFNYTRWRIAHKLLGVFFILGLVHYTTVETLSKMTIPGSYMLVMCVIGIAFYIYRQFFSRLFEPYRGYTVAEVNKLNGQTVEVILKPMGKAIIFQAGQFAYVNFSPGRTLREPHPFTISSAPKDDTLRFTIKSSGDWTNHLVNHLEPGMKAAVHGGFGEFNCEAGKEEQVWIAGGIGVTPFLSWMRDPEILHQRKINLFYSVRGNSDALFWEEIEQAARANNSLSADIRYSSAEGSYSVDEILEKSGGVAKDKEYYLCGPIGMTEAFSSQLKGLGVPANQIHYEEFNFR
ncbi:MAG: hypothetical protein HND51_23030 [Chloroflexi bacterium]|nr:hypothetical protein [Chloroflexota bacterium]